MSNMFRLFLMRCFFLSVKKSSSVSHRYCECVLIILVLSTIRGVRGYIETNRNQSKAQTWMIDRTTQKMKRENERETASRWNKGHMNTKYVYTCHTYTHICGNNITLTMGLRLFKFRYCVSYVIWRLVFARFDGCFFSSPYINNNSLLAMWCNWLFEKRLKRYTIECQTSTKDSFNV